MADNFLKRQEENDMEIRDKIAIDRELPEEAREEEWLERARDETVGYYIPDACVGCPCVCCDCMISTYLCSKKNCEKNTDYHMNPFNPYLACIYPPKRAASVIPTMNTNNNLNPGYCVYAQNRKRNCQPNFPGSSADLCSHRFTEIKNVGDGTNTLKFCSRLGIRLYKAGAPETRCNDPLAPNVPEPEFGMMNSMPPACMIQCNNKDENKCGEQKCCTVIIKSTPPLIGGCGGTRFGCCKDEVSYATGPDQAGCD